MTYKDFLGQLLKLMLPLAFQNFMLTLVSATDALVLARVDQNPVAAVSLATEITFVMNLFLGTVIGGIAILAAQYMGKGDRHTVQKLMAMGLRYNIAISLIFFLGAVLAPEALMGLYTNDPLLRELGAGYLRIAGISFLLSAVSQAYLCVMKLSGGSMVCAVITTVTAVVDVLVDLYLVYGLQMGARGTAVSTVAVCLVELVGVLVYSHRKGRLHPALSDMNGISKQLQADFWKVSLPVLAGSLVWGLGFSLSSAVMGHQGADAAAAFAIASVLRKLFTCFIRGLGTGAGILVGNALGKNDLEAARQLGGRLSRAAVWCGVFSCLVFCLLAPSASRFFILNDGARAYLNQMIPVCGAYLIAQSLSVTIICGIFPAGGDTVFDAAVTAVTMWLLALPLGILAAALQLPPIVVYLLLCLDEFAKCFAIYPRYKKFLWLKNITRDIEKSA